MPESGPIRVLIVDDEPLGCTRLAQLLAQQSGVEVVGVAEDGEEAIEAIRSTRPDLVLLDIQMPRKSGLDVVREVGPASMPATIFVTAREQHALEAFECAAVDYLLKPFSDQRFEEALHRARRQITLEGLEGLRKQLLDLLDAAQPSPTPRAQRRYLERITVHMRGRLRIVPVKEIDYIVASGVYAEIHAGTERHIIRESLVALEEQLDPEQFFRIHRSAIVRLDQVELVLRGGGGDYDVQLRSGVVLPVGRTRREELERRLGRVQ